MAATFRQAYLRGGYAGFWRTQLEIAHGWAETHPETALTLTYARILLRLNDKDRALNYLKTALEEGDPDLFDLTVDPLYDPVRSDPRFRGFKPLGSEHSSAMICPSFIVASSGS